MADPRIERMAHLLVNYSAGVKKGDRVFIEAEPDAEPLIREIFRCVLENGGHPHLAISLAGFTSKSGLDDIFMEFADDEQLDYVPTFYKLAYDTFESRIRIWSQSNTKALSNIDRVRLMRREKVLEAIVEAQLSRGDKGDFRWVTTIFPTLAYAQDAEMNLSEFEELVFQACHVDIDNQDPITYWEGVEAKQNEVVDALNDSDLFEVSGPHCDLSFSVRGRTFQNACGRRNMPDGEVYTGPVEDSVNGWVHFSLPSTLSGNDVEGIELKFREGRVVEASAEKNQGYLEHMLETDSGARYVGEFAIGTNYGIQQRTRNILLDEKIGGTIHLALGAGYPKTGSVNKSAIHWDMITELKEGGEIRVDGSVVYKNGIFQL